MIKKFLLPLVVMGLASVAQAGSITYSAGLVGGNAAYSETLSLQKFDTTLGTLTGVTIQLELSGRVFGVIRGSAPLPYTDVVFSVPVTLTGPDGSNAIATSSTGSLSGIAPVGPEPLGVQFTSGSARTSIPSDNWGSYSGVGSGLAQFSVSSGSQTQTGNVPSGVRFSLTHSIGGTASITYDFTPATVVPEPATVAAALMGAAAFAFARLRRKAA